MRCNMSNEDINESYNVESMDHEITDAELDAAFQDFMGLSDSDVNTVEGGDNVESEENVIDGKKETNEINDTNKDVQHSESSRLGRKVARIETKMVSKDEFDSLNSKIDSLLQKLNSKKEEPVYDEYGEVVQKSVSEEDVTRIIEERDIARERESKRKNMEYQSNYLESLRDLMDDIEDPQIAKEVYKKMVAPDSEFNKKLSDNPFKDVAKNFNRALRYVSSKKTFTGNRNPSIPNGVTTSNTNTGVTKKPIKLDPEAEEFARSTGMTAEEIEEALSGEIPITLRNRMNG